MKTDILQERIYRYLLGDLPEEEESALEQEFLADADLFEQVWAAENELIDQYVRGKLTPADKNFFENHYLASPVHRERLAFAKNLVQAADSSGHKEKSGFGTDPANLWGSLLAGWKSNRFRWAMATAVLLFAASSVWLFAENRRMQMIQARHREAVEQRIQELEKELSAQREQRDELAAELAGLRDEQSPTVGSQTQTQPNQGEQRSVVSFLLSPVLMRSGGDPQELKIPKDITAVLLKIKIEEPDGRSFQATLRTVEGAQVWSRGALKARQPEKNGLTVSVSIPANKLPTSDYILTLSATNQANEIEEINRYFFRVIKQ